MLYLYVGYTEMEIGIFEFKNEYIKYKEKLLKYGNIVTGKDELKVEGEGKHKWKKLGLLR